MPNNSDMARQGGFSLSASVFAAVLIAIALRSPTFAAVPSWGVTIEGKAANADVILVGRVQSIVPAVKPDEFSIVTASVGQMLKGPSATSVSFRAIVSPGDPFWTSSHEAVFFLQTGTKYSGRGWSTAKFLLVLDQLAFSDPVDLVSDPEVLSTDMQPGLSRDRILQLIRDHCGVTGNVTMEDIPGPPGPDGNFGRGRPAILEIPIDPAMEVIARRWATSPDPAVRWNAGRVLRHARSPENISALESISRAPVNSTVSFLARELALDRLRKWGQPTAPRPFPILQALLLTLGALLPAIPLTVVYVRKARRSAQPPSRATLFFLRAGSIAAVSVLASFLLLSWFAPLGFCSGDAEIGFCRGDVVLVERTHDEIDHTQPWRLAGSDELWTVRDCADRRADSGVLPGRFGRIADDGGDKVWPQWTRLLGFAIPLWLPIVLILVPNLAVWGFSALRRAVRNARPGFPVNIPNQSAGPTTSA
jgi:hypothetical protein